MCPDKKLRYFEENPDWRPDDVKGVRQLIEERWREYIGHPRPQADHSQRSKWARRERSAVAGPSKSTSSHNSIEAYLNAPIVSHTEILSAGGILIPEILAPHACHPAPPCTDGTRLSLCTRYVMMFKFLHFELGLNSHRCVQICNQLLQLMLSAHFPAGDYESTTYSMGLVHSLSRQSSQLGLGLALRCYPHTSPKKSSALV